MRYRFLALLLAVLIVFPALHASVMYSFTGTGYIAGTSFVVESPSYLTYSYTQYAAQSGRLVTGGVDKGAVSDVEFFYGNQAAGVTSINISVGRPFTSLVSMPFRYDVGKDGVYTDQSGTLTIQSSPAVTPEPSSLLLLGTGLVGAAAAVRRRLPA